MTRFIRLGLLIESQYYIPGYTGRLCIGVLNVSGNVVQLAPKMRLRYGSVGIMLLQRIREKRHLLVPRQELEWDAAWSLLSRSL